MVIFIDTSSLIKRYIEEEGSSLIDKYYDEKNDICISPITSIEFYSALARKLRENTISMDTYNKAIVAWKKEEINYNIVFFNRLLVLRAIELIEREVIKTLDSIQLSSAIFSVPDEFVTSDKRLFDLSSKYLTCKLTLI